jgi:hypothetical protein
MLRKNPPRYPEWPAPYTATWEGDQWIVLFPTEEDALAGLRMIRQGDDDKLFPMLAVAPHPGGGRTWYIGQVHP